MKTILNTTENSNFILNMSAETLSKYIRNLLIICVFLPFIGGLAWLLNDSAAYFGAGLLTLSGFTSALLFMVALLKKDVLFQKNIANFLIVALCILAAVSACRSFDSTISLFGNKGRNEGLLAILSYGGLFFLGSLISKKKDTESIFDSLIFIGIIQSVIGILQHIPILDFPSSFKNLYSVAVDNCFLSSGTSGSPIFFGTFLTLVSGIAIAGACYNESSKKRKVYGGSVLLFFLASLYTGSIIPLIGIPLAFITACIIELVRIRKNSLEIKPLFKKPLGELIKLAAFMALIFLVVFFSEGISIRDKAIAFEDSYYKLFISGPLSIKQDSFYSHTWGKTLEIILRHPFEGTGPDCLYYPQIVDGNLPGTANLFDKSYNDYLYIAATRGIPSLIIYIALIVLTLKRSFGSIGKFFESSENWYKAALLSSILAYLAVMFFGVSTISVAPFFWILLGIANNRKIN